MTTFRGKAGFTLLEMMVVVFIIAVITTMIGVNIATESSQKRIDETGDQLYRQMLLATDTALLSGNTIGLQIKQIENENGDIHWHYAWYQYIKNQWQLLPKPLPTTELPAEVTLELFVEDELIEDIHETPGMPKTLAENGSGLQSSPTVVKPSVIISPTGEITDFTLQLIDSTDSGENKASYRISIDETGALSIADRNEEH